MGIPLLWLGVFPAAFPLFTTATVFSCIAMYKEELQILQDESKEATR
jgi:hypothetical protein